MDRRQYEFQGYDLFELYPMLANVGIREKLAVISDEEGEIKITSDEVPIQLACCK
jgi:hypothetical protein